MRLITLIVVLALASIAQANPPVFAPCSQAAFSFQYQAAFAPVYQQQVFAAPVYQQRVFAAPVYSQRVFAAPVYSQRAFAPVFVPASQVNVNVRQRGLFGQRTSAQVITGGASQVNVNVGRRGLFR
jgi:hypothetical protein